MGRLNWDIYSASTITGRLNWGIYSVDALAICRIIICWMNMKVTLRMKDNFFLLDLEPQDTIQDKTYIKNIAILYHYTHW